MNEPNDTVSSRRSVGASLMPAALSYLSLHTLFLAPISPLSAHHLFATQIGIGAFKKAAERKGCRWPGHMVNEATETQRSLQWTINEKTYPYSLARLFHLSLSFLSLSLLSFWLCTFNAKKIGSADKRRADFLLRLQSWPDSQYFSPTSPWSALLIFIHFIRVIFSPRTLSLSFGEAFPIALSSLINQAINTEERGLDERKTVTAIGKRARKTVCYCGLWRMHNSHIHTAHFNFVLMWR